MRRQIIFLISLLGAVPAFADEYDIVIRNGRVLDGAGNPWILADVAISDGRFTRIGKVTGSGKREIDASGLYVSPGFIDMMDQSGEVLLENGRAANKVLMGVTSAIGGEGGTPVATEGIRESFERISSTGPGPRASRLPPTNTLTRPAGPGSTPPCRGGCSTTGRKKRARG